MFEVASPEWSLLTRLLPADIQQAVTRRELALEYAVSLYPQLLELNKCTSAIIAHIGWQAEDQTRAALTLENMFSILNRYALRDYEIRRAVNDLSPLTDDFDRTVGAVGKSLGDAAWFIDSNGIRRWHWSLQDLAGVIVLAAYRLGGPPPERKTNAVLTVTSVVAVKLLVDLLERVEAHNAK